jgi:hypothetical protein
MYLQLVEKLLDIIDPHPEHELHKGFDQSTVMVVKKGPEKFNEYNGIMKRNDIYYIATILGPQVKTKWLK